MSAPVVVGGGPPQKSETPVAAGVPGETRTELSTQSDSTTAPKKILPYLFDRDPPIEIKHKPSWLMWRFEDHPGGGKRRKMPYYANGSTRSGTQGSLEDTKHLVPFTAARDAAIRMGFDGVGFAPLEKWGIVAVDLDNCVQDGKIHPDIEPLLGQTYSEFSPSGKGLRLLYKGNLGNGKDLTGDYGVELFSTKGFVTYTGNVTSGCELLGLENTVATVSEELNSLHRERFTREAPESTNPIGLTDALIQQCLDALPRDLHYDDWVRVGMSIHCETGGKGFELWEQWSEQSPKYGGRRYDQERWRSFGKGSGLQVTGASLVKLANQYGAGIVLNGPASPEEFDVLVETAEGKADEKSARFPYEWAHEFASGTPPTWLIKHVLPQAELVVMYGASQSGKSFLALDMAAAIARGVPWRGKRVRQGKVVYIAAEGAGGFRNRLKAFSIANDIPLNDIPLAVIHAVPNFLDKADAAEVAATVRGIGEVKVIIVDTFAKVTAGGDENSGADMGKALAHCAQIHKMTGAVVLLVHHSGKDASKGARGWSGVRAAADAELEVVREETGRYVRLSKQKDGEDDLRWGFDLEVVQVGVDEDLDPITSCVVIEAEVPTGKSKQFLGSRQKVLLSCFDELEGAGDVVADQLINLAAGRLIKPEAGRDTRRQHCKVALRTLCQGGTPWLVWGSDDVITRSEGNFA